MTCTCPCHSSNELCHQCCDGGVWLKQEVDQLGAALEKIYETCHLTMTPSNFGLIINEIVDICKEVRPNKSNA